MKEMPRYCLQKMHPINNIHYTNPSLCIPCVNKNTTPEDVKATIDNLCIGKIKKIDIIPLKKKDSNMNRVFIHFHTWHKNERVDRIQEKLSNGSCIKVFYNEPWFWKISISKFQEECPW